MKIKLTVQERRNLKQLIENPQIGGGTSLGQIRDMLALVEKLEYTGKQDADTMTDLELEPSHVKKLYQAANNFSGWPVTKQTLDMKERLESYNNKIKDNE